jgi:predicted nucleotidyltransferase
MAAIPNVFETRATSSRTRLDDVRANIKQLDELTSIKDLTIFAAGSYARLEASEYSDIDMFFLCMENRDKQIDPRTKELRLFGKMIEIVDKLKFPKFSNDCEYLNILSINDILQHLGSPKDDHDNYFTARMLLLLESKCLYGQEVYKKIITDIVHSYFFDYPTHSQKFQPIFLLNDICRYWKTILLNYENKRNRLQETPEQKTKHRVRNFKLKFSRMTTCFATISALGSYNTPVSEEQVIGLVNLTPRERIQDILSRIPQAENEVQDILERYAWFLEMTALSTEELHKLFYEEKTRTEMFQLANDYGNSMFKLILKLDDLTEGNNGLMRYLVI